MADRDKALILIADDDPAARMILGPAIAQAGFEIVEAEDGRQAVEIFAERRPDLVILDVIMPVKDGFAACAEMRKVPGGDAVPILMLTGLDDLESIQKAYEVGATDFAPKPMNWLVLAHRVRYMIRGKDASDALRLSEARLASAQRIAQLGNWEWNPRTEYFECSEELRRLLGVSLGGPVRMDDLLNRIHAEDREAVREALAECDVHGRPRSFDFRVQQAEESLLYLHGEADPVRDASGRALRISGTIQNVTERTLAEKKIRALAYFDVLTGLPNRALFDRQLGVALNNARRHQESLAILFLDLDHFKRINDTLGHNAGDQLLQAFAERLQRNIRSTDAVTRTGEEESGDTVARLGGDEFILLLTNIRHGADASRVALRILECLKEPFRIDTEELFATASIGISLFPNDGEDAETLLKNADIAMYHAKSKGRNNYQFYNLSMNTSAFHRLSMETRLRRAVARGEFLLYYQPLVDAREERTVGVEALIRWKHPDIGLILPLDFIPLAEETGLILPIGEWVLHEACAQGRRWQEAGFKDLRVAINLSAQQFQHQSPSTIRDAILAEGLDPSRVELEITESLLMGDAIQMRRTLENFKKMGVRISIDDFGTGYSSLSYLKKYPIDVLKIDRSFVRDLLNGPDDRAITVAIIAMARSLRKEVIAEGVETTEQRDFLLQEGCSSMQGFLFSRPVPASEITALLTKERAVRCEIAERDR